MERKGIVAFKGNPLTLVGNELRIGVKDWDFLKNKLRLEVCHEKMILVVFGIFFILGFAVFADAIHEIIPSETTVPLPGADAVKLNEYIIKYNPYRAWDLWPEKGRLYKGTEPHGALLTTFVNDTALHSIKKKKV